MRLRLSRSSNAVAGGECTLPALHEAAGVSGDARMRELAAHIAFPSWPGATSATALKRAAQEAEITAVLDEYAFARPLIRPADQERWELAVADMQRRSGEDSSRTSSGAARRFPLLQRSSADVRIGAAARRYRLRMRLCGRWRHAAEAVSGVR